MTAKTKTNKIVALMCVIGVMTLTNTPLVYAYTAHTMSVTANIVDDSVTITPSGENFCNDGSLKVGLMSALPGASIYYTLDGTEPVCKTNGTLYSETFSLSTSKTVKAVACHDDVQSLTMVRNFNLSDSFCDKTSLKINKVYSNTDDAHMTGNNNNENEWVEIYNPTAASINLKGWKICDEEECDVLSTKDLSVPAYGYAVVTDKAATWNLWNIPESAIKIALGSEIGNGLSNENDLVLLRNANGDDVDQVNWGTPNSNWPNYNEDIFTPGYEALDRGEILGRIINGYDTDRISDWTAFSLPEVTVTYPNGGETFVVGKTYTITWTATGAKSSGYKIDLYYSNDSGATWMNIARGVANDGSYDWKLPLVMKKGGCSACATACTACSSCVSGLGCYYIVPSAKARIKVVATDYATNFMLSNWDTTDKDFCPPIDASLLTAEELEIMKLMDTTGMDVINSSALAAPKSALSTDVAETDEKSDDATGTGAVTKASEILNKEDDEIASVVIKIEGDDDGNKSDEDAAGDDSAAGSASLEGVTAALQTAEATVESSDVEAAATAVSGATEAIESVIAPDSDATIEFNLNA